MEHIPALSNALFKRFFPEYFDFQIRLEYAFLIAQKDITWLRQTIHTLPFSTAVPS